MISAVIQPGRKAESWGRVVLFDVRSGKRMASIGEERDLVLAADASADGKVVALDGPRKVVRVYSVADGRLA